MGAVFGNITVMQFANLLIIVGLLVLIIVLAVLLAAHFSGSRNQQKLILSHIDGTVSEIRDAVLAEQKENTSEHEADPVPQGEQIDQEEPVRREELTVVRIDNRIKPAKKAARRRPVVVSIDGRLPETEGNAAEELPGEQKTSCPEDTAADSAQVCFSQEKNDGKETDGEKNAESSQKTPGHILENSEPSRGIRYRRRDCGMDKNGNEHSLDQLREQIR